MSRTAHFPYYCFAAVRERRDCLVAKTIYFNITKPLRPGNIANGAQNPFEAIKFAILSRSSFSVYTFDFLNDERGKRKTGDAATCAID